MRASFGTKGACLPTLFLRAGRSHSSNPTFATFGSNGTEGQRPIGQPGPDLAGEPNALPKPSDEPSSPVSEASQMSFAQTLQYAVPQSAETFGPSAAYAARSNLVLVYSPAVKSSMPSPSGKEPQKSRTAPFRSLGG